tara:strand:- start:5800 stop:6048 length:249 start_codon:yes stop_codon:yes gene_type:complete
MITIKYTLENINSIVILLIQYSKTKNTDLIKELIKLLGDDTDTIEYDKYYNNYIISNRDMFFQYSKNDFKLWCNLVYKLYEC